MSEEKNGLEGAQADETLQKTAEMEVVVDPSRAAPVYVSAVSMGRKAGSPFVFVSFYSGASIPVGPSVTKSVNTLIASFVLDVEQAKFLYQNLKDFLGSVGEEV